MYCHACGQPLEPADKFCTQCGTPLPVVNVPLAAPSHNPPSLPLPNERLRITWMPVTVACAVLGFIALGTLHSQAAWITVLALVAFALSWPRKSIGAAVKLGFLVTVLIVVAAVNVFEGRRQSSVETSQQPASPIVGQTQDVTEQKAESQADAAFKKMTPREHLEAVKRDFTAGASENELEDGNRNVDALKGSSLEKQGEALQQRYYARAQRQAESERQSELESERIQYAQTLQTNLLDSDMDADVNAIGRRHTTLQLKYVLATKLFVYKFSKEVLPEYIDDMRRLEFKKLVVTNGYDQQWTWNL